MVLILPIFLTSCKTIEYVYVYPDLINPVIEEIPVNSYIDGGFSYRDGGLFISKNDAMILARYILDLKEWGSNGWTWITDYYIKELDRLKSEGENNE